MSGKKMGKKPTYRDLEQDIAQLARFVQSVSGVVLQLDGEVVGMRNELEKQGILEPKPNQEIEGVTQITSSPSSDEVAQGQVEISEETGTPEKVVTQAKTEDYFPVNKETK